MATKNVNKTRLLMKHDIEANWLKAENFIPLEGEIVVYDADETHSRPRMKIGDGETQVGALPFATVPIDVDELEGSVVKTINGVGPDENGEISVNAARKVVFVYMPMTGDLMCTETAAEINELLSVDNTYHGLQFALRVYDFVDPMAATPVYIYTRIDTESIDNGGTYYKLIHHIHFNDDEIAPVLVDVINNTITFDPDWVAPVPVEDQIAAAIEGLATESYVDTAVANLVDSSPDTLNTLNELAAALGDDPNFSTTIINQIAEKADKTTTINGKALNNNITLNASDVKALPNTISIKSGTSPNSIIACSADDESSTYTIGQSAFAEGHKTQATALASHAEGFWTKATGGDSHSEGSKSVASGNHSHAEGSSSIASGQISHAEGNNTVASGSTSHAEGKETLSSGSYSHAEGNKSVAKGESAHAEGEESIALGNNSHSEGQSMAMGNTAHSEGDAGRRALRLTGAANATTYTYSNAAFGMSVGFFISLRDKITDKVAIITELSDTTITVSETLSSEDLTDEYAVCFPGAAKGDYSHVEGEGTYAGSARQHVQGAYNIPDDENRYAHIVGGGIFAQRKNIHTLNWNGIAWFAGDVLVGGTGQEDAAAEKLVKQSEIANFATESYVETAVANLVDSSPDALNTLNELAAALGDDPNFATTVTNQIAGKASIETLNNRVPETNEPHKQLITDKDGKTAWEERTHYEGEYVEYFSEISVTLSPADFDLAFPYYQANMPMEYFSWAVPNKLFTFTYNGIDYNCEYYEYNNMLVAGNLRAAGLPYGNDDAPFIITGAPVNSQTVVLTLLSLNQDAGETVTLKVSNNGTRIKKLDKKFMPDGLFYMESAQTHIIVPEQTLTYEDDTASTGPMNESLIVGQEYTVVWDGVTYKCIAGEIYYPPFDTNVKYLGRSGAFDTTPSNTDEPFMLVDAPESINPNRVALVIDYNYTLGNHTISVTRNVPASKIPIEHLPIEYATDDEILEVLASLDALPVVTDANGAILTDENSNILLV